MSLQSLPGLVLGSRHSSTIGSEGWRLSIIVLPSWFSGGRFIHREAVGTLPPQMNFLMLLSHGLVTRIHGSERRGEGRKTGETDLASSNLVDLDGLEPLQNPPDPQEGRLRDPSVQAFLRTCCSIRGFV